MTTVDEARRDIPVSVVITTRNRHASLMRCVKSVCKSSHRPTELIVVDDCSSDATRNLTESTLRESFPLDGVGLTVIHGQTQLRMVKARNLGARAAAGAYVLFIDDDNVIDAMMVEELIRFFQVHHDYGIAGPAMHLCSTRSKYLDFQTIGFFTGRTVGHIDKSERPYCDTQGVPNVFMIRAAVFKDVGYFDEDLIQTYTEPDFSFHAARTGYKSAMVKRAITYHDIPALQFTPRSLGGEFAQKAYCLMRNRALIAARYGRWYHKIVYLLVFSWMWAVIYSVLVLRFGRFDLIRLYWYGWRDGVIYGLTGRLLNSLPKLMPEENNAGSQPGV
jgi:GT2 family glycosyltransferase